MLPIEVTSADCEAVLERCRTASAEWSQRPIAARLQLFKRARQIMAREARTLAATVHRTPLSDTLVAEVLPLLDGIRFLERRARQILATRKLRGGRPLWLFGISAEIQRAPLGVVLILGPGNYPLFLPAIQAVQALVAGNGVCLKPAPGGEASAAAFASILQRAGLPQHVLELIDSSKGGDAVACSFDRIVLTGSAQTGIKVLEATARRLIPSTLELSGCDAVFVLPGSNLSRVARCLAYALRLNGGATCIAPRRVFVLESDAAQLEQWLTPLLQGIPAANIPLPVEQQLISLLKEAERSGGRVIRPNMKGPVIIADARASLARLSRDLFAPWLAIVPVATVEEALAENERCPYALGASIFGPPKVAKQFATRVPAGSICINDVIAPTADPRLPFGGNGLSGFGRTRGAEGLLEMTSAKSVSVRHGSILPHLASPRAEDEHRFLRLIRILHCPWRG